ncbi:MAG: hypothetical protein SVE93_06195 [Candidatus Thermoplasmatota archaeon]|nr:hypothetical protein [Candidatus Thermoplasmatota archaeon]
MNPAELFAVQGFTLAIVALTAFLFYKLLMRYMQTPAPPAFFLMLYFLFFSADYFVTFLLRFPDETNSIVLSYPFIAILSFIIGRSRPFFGAMFGVFTLAPKRWRGFALLPISLVVLATALVIIYPPSFREAGIGEWVIGEGATLSVFISIAMALIAPLCVLAYSIVTKDKRQRIKGLIISASFFALVFLVDFQEPLGAVFSLPVRRALVFFSMILLYAGFTL